MPRRASVGPWKHVIRYQTAPRIVSLRTWVPGPAQVDHWPRIVPHTFVQNAHTGRISIIEDAIAIVWAQSAIGL